MLFVFYVFIQLKMLTTTRSPTAEVLDINTIIIKIWKQNNLLLNLIYFPSFFSEHEAQILVKRCCDLSMLVHLSSFKKSTASTSNVYKSSHCDTNYLFFIFYLAYYCIFHLLSRKWTFLVVLNILDVIIVEDKCRVVKYVVIVFVLKFRFRW